MISRISSARAVGLVLLVGLVAGCSDQRAGGVDRLWSDAEVPMLAPLKGEWKFDEERTFRAWREAGVSEEEIAATRGMRTRIAETLNSKEMKEKLRKLGVEVQQSQQAHANLHPNLNFAANAATGAGKPNCEYRFFNLHRHGETICGKAWHHEDRDDPGDMSKCYVQLNLVNDELRLKVKMQDGSGDVEDSDFVNPPAIVSGASDTCDAEKPAGNAWDDDWIIYAFVRPKDAK